MLISSRFSRNTRSPHIRLESRRASPCWGVPIEAFSGHRYPHPYLHYQVSGIRSFPVPPSRLQSSQHLPITYQTLVIYELSNHDTLNINIPYSIGVGQSIVMDTFKQSATSITTTKVVSRKPLRLSPPSPAFTSGYLQIVTVPGTVANGARLLSRSSWCL